MGDARLPTGPPTRRPRAALLPRPTRRGDRRSARLPARHRAQPDQPGPGRTSRSSDGQRGRHRQEIRMNQAEMEQSLRALLAERAEQAHVSDELAEQIITQAATGVPPVRQLHRPTVRRRSWMMPMLVAAAVVAVIAATIGFFALGNNSSGKGKAPLAITKHA